MSDPVPPSPEPQPPVEAAPAAAPERPAEVGGRRPNVSNGLDPTRFGDWEKNGRCIDF